MCLKRATLFPQTIPSILCSYHYKCEYFSIENGPLPFLCAFFLPSSLVPVTALLPHFPHHQSCQVVLSVLKTWPASYISENSVSRTVLITDPCCSPSQGRWHLPDKPDFVVNMCVPSRRGVVARRAVLHHPRHWPAAAGSLWHPGDQRLLGMHLR